MTKTTTQACALNGNRTNDLLLCGVMLNKLSHTDQGHLAFNVQEGGLGTRDKVIGALDITQRGATPFLSCNSGCQGKEHK